jgi:hypothetical protein
MINATYPLDQPSNAGWGSGQRYWNINFSY